MMMNPNNRHTFYPADMLLISIIVIMYYHEV